jgi:hypothetical protein
MDQSLDIWEIGFVLLPLIVGIVAQIILNFLFGKPFSAIIDGDTYLEVYLISYAVSVLSAVGLYLILKRRARQYREYHRALHHIEEK